MSAPAPVEAIRAMALLPICDSSFMCEDYNAYRAHPWSPFPQRRAHPGPGPYTREGVSGARGESRLDVRGERETTGYETLRLCVRVFHASRFRVRARG